MMSVKMTKAYAFMLDLLYDSTGEMTLGQAQEITAETFDLTSEQERELLMRYFREHY